jgi:hypothetical protein
LGLLHEAKTQTGQLDLKEAVFDYNGGMYGVLLAALPLKEDFKATSPLFQRTMLNWTG